MMFVGWRGYKVGMLREQGARPQAELWREYEAAAGDVRLQSRADEGGCGGREGETWCEVRGE